MSEYDKSTLTQLKDFISIFLSRGWIYAAATEEIAAIL